MLSTGVVRAPGYERYPCLGPGLEALGEPPYPLPDVPWVKASGTTCPVCIFWSLSSPTAAAALSPSSMSLFQDIFVLWAWWPRPPPESRPEAQDGP